MRIFIHALIALACLMVFRPHAAGAQTMLQREKELYEIPVNERVPSDLRPQGLTYRGFVYQPRLSVTGVYDSDVRAGAGDRKSDFSLGLKPELFLRKDYSGHIISAHAGANIVRFSSLSSENRADLSARIRGLFDLNSRWSVPVSVSAGKQARERDAPLADIRNATRAPEDIKHIAADIGITRHFNKLSLTFLTQARKIVHDNGRSLLTGAPVIFSDQDRTALAGILRARYALPRGGDDTPEHILFADFKYEKQNYERGRYQGGTFSGPSADNNRYGVLAGIETSYKGLLFASLGAGYTQVDYNSAALGDTGLFTLDGDVSYMLTPRLQIGLEAMRRLNQDSDYLRGFRQNRFALNADYEIRHDIYAHAGASYEQNHFIGNDRKDKTYGAVAGLRLLHSPSLESGLSLDFTDRNSNRTGADFERYQIMLRLTGKL